MDVRRDIVERLERARIDYYVTGSEALALLGVAFRATNDIDLVLQLADRDYDLRLRPALEPDYLVSNLVATTHRRLGSAIHVASGTGKVDFVLRDAGPWADEAFARRRRVDDPGVGPLWVSTIEDLLLAKLEWADGSLEGLQGRDVERILRVEDPLDLDYVRRMAGTLGLEDILETAVRRAR